MCILQNHQISKKCYFHHFTKMSFFVKNHEKFDHHKIGLHHCDFFTISNVLTGAPKNAKICLYCIWHADSVFLDSFFNSFYLSI